MLHEPYYKIWEIENFWKNMERILSHPSEYEELTKFRSYAVVWKTKRITEELNSKYVSRRIGDYIIQVDPLNGEINYPASHKKFEHFPSEIQPEQSQVTLPLRNNDTLPLKHITVNFNTSSQLLQMNLT